jgi:NAD+ synthase (glutamine-hydrolysing)
MCRLVVAAIKANNEEVIADVKRIAVYSDKLPETAEEFCNQIFHTVYMGMEKQSSKETRQRAKDLSKRIGSYHTDMNIDDTFHATKNLLTQGTGFEPKFKVHGGSTTENRMLICLFPAITRSSISIDTNFGSGIAKHPSP